MRINAERETPCGWGIYVDKKAACPAGLEKEGADPNLRNCPLRNVEECSRAWGEYSNCPKLRAKGYYGGSRRE